MDDDKLPPLKALSLVDQWKLKSATFMNTATGIMRDDTKAHPERYPIYAVYLVIMTVPVPEFGIPFMLSLGALAWIKLRLTKDARWMDDRLTAAFNEKAMMSAHKDFIAADEKNAGKYKVSTLALAKQTHKTSMADAKEATRVAFTAFGNLFKRKPPEQRPPPDGLPPPPAPA